MLSFCASTGRAQSIQTPADVKLKAVVTLSRLDVAICGVRALVGFEDSAKDPPQLFDASVIATGKLKAGKLTGLATVITIDHLDWINGRFIQSDVPTDVHFAIEGQPGTVQIDAHTDGGTTLSGVVNNDPGGKLGPELIGALVHSRPVLMFVIVGVDSWAIRVVGGMSPADQHALEDCSTRLNSMASAR